jgi:hypothetical protein
MKKSVVFVVLVLSVLLISSFAVAFFHKEDVRLEPADVGVTVNSPPTIDDINSGVPISATLIQNGDAGVSFTFTATESDSGDNLVDGSITASFSRGGETTRSTSDGLNDGPGNDECVCTVGCATNTRTYTCQITMRYFDDDGTQGGGDAWDASVSIDDSFGATGSQTNANFVEVGLLQAIVFSSGEPIGFPIVEPLGVDYISTADLVLDNQGNFDTATDGNIEVRGEDLCEEAVPLDCNPGTNTDVLPTENFNSANTGAAVCTGVGTTLVESTSTIISGAILSKGTGTNDGALTFCLTSVPGAVISETYLARTGHADANQLGPWEVTLN